jgi:hypothetical protein
VKDVLAAHQIHSIVSFPEGISRLRFGFLLQCRLHFLDTLQAQWALFLTQDALAQSTQTISTNLVALCKALGGG